MGLGAVAPEVCKGRGRQTRPTGGGL